MACLGRAFLPSSFIKGAVMLAGFVRSVVAMIALCVALLAQVQVPDGNGGWKNAGAGDFKGTVTLGGSGGTSYWEVHDAGGGSILRVAKNPIDGSVSPAEEAALNFALDHATTVTVTVTTPGGIPGVDGVN